MTRTALIASATLLVLGCRSEKATPPAPAPPPAQAKESLQQGCDTAGAACNSVKLAGPAIKPQKVAGTAPAPTGGALEPGTYALVETRAYTGEGGAVGPMDHMEQMTLVITRDGEGFKVEGAEGHPGCPDKHENLTLTFSGTDSIAQRTCPPCGPNDGRDCRDRRPYTWDGKALTEFIRQDGQMWTRTFAPVSQ